ncbi:hypothetical protein J6590_075061 [Homalodisca vitripennis]|nr:hypothetical protein J6590_075061 [Homalodisca vitripennis]
MMTYICECLNDCQNWVDVKSPNSPAPWAPKANTTEMPLKGFVHECRSPKGRTLLGSRAGQFPMTGCALSWKVNSSFGKKLKKSKQRGTGPLKAIYI